MDIDKALEYIHSVKWRGSRLGLQRTRELLARLGNPEKSLKFVHIAGTDGKGSTAACIESVLRRSGYRTGLYISPYISIFNERMQVNGEWIPDGELAELTELIKPHAEAMADPPTEFEMITAIAMCWFKSRRCDIVVLEAGLGGKLDSTNVIDVPEAAVITAMGFDHVKELGPTMTDIAGAKAGIIKEGGRVAIYGGDPEADAVFNRVCREKHAELRKVDFDGLNVKSCGLDGSVFDYDGIENIHLPLAGTYQPGNAALAITALRILEGRGWQVTDSSIKAGLESVRWPGRFEILRRDPVFILDGAHNPHGIKAAAESLKALCRGHKLVFVMGVMADKDVHSMTDIIAPLAERFVAVTPDNPRSMPARELAERLEKYGLPATACGTIREGVELAVKAAGKDGYVCALGSLYFSDDVRRACMSISE